MVVVEVVCKTAPSGGEYDNNINDEWDITYYNIMRRMGTYHCVTVDRDNIMYNILYRSISVIIYSSVPVLCTQVNDGYVVCTSI